VLVKVAETFEKEVELSGKIRSQHLPDRRSIMVFGIVSSMLILHRADL
jgi:hypothetical protein